MLAQHTVTNENTAPKTTTPLVPTYQLTRLDNLAMMPYSCVLSQETSSFSGLGKYIRRALTLQRTLLDIFKN